MLVRRSRDESDAHEPAASVAPGPADSSLLPAEECRRLALAQADPAAFRWFYDQYGPGILLFLRGLVRDHGVAEELHARVFAQALLGIDRYRWRGAPYGAYLHRIAVNQAKSHWRSRRGRQFVEADADLPWPDPRADVLSGLITAAETRRLREAIAELPAADRTVLTMHYWESLSTVQIAATLGEPQGTIRARLKRARDKLERALAEESPPTAPKAGSEGRPGCLTTALQRRLGWQRGLG